MTPSLWDTEAEVAEIVHAFAGLGCAQIADAAPKYTHALPSNLVPRTPSVRMAGQAFPLEIDNDLLAGLQALDAAPKGTVLVIHNVAPVSDAVAGDIFVCAAASQGLAGLVVNGAIRDVEGCREFGLPVFAREVTFLSAKRAEKPATRLPATVVLGGVTIEPGTWLFGDADGLIAVPRKAISTVLSAALVVQQREALVKRQLREGRRIADVTNLHAFLAGQGDLRAGF